MAKKIIEKVLEQTFKEIRDEIKELDELVNFNPYPELQEIHKAANRLIKEHKETDYKDNKILNQIKDLGAREKYLLAKAKQANKGLITMMDRKAELESEERELAMLQSMLKMRNII